MSSFSAEEELSRLKRMNGSQTAPKTRIDESALKGVFVEDVPVKRKKPMGLRVAIAGLLLTLSLLMSQVVMRDSEVMAGVQAMAFSIAGFVAEKKGMTEPIAANTPPVVSADALNGLIPLDESEPDAPGLSKVIGRDDVIVNRISGDFGPSHKTIFVNPAN